MPHDLDNVGTLAKPKKSEIALRRMLIAESFRRLVVNDMELNRISKFAETLGVSQRKLHICSTIYLGMSPGQFMIQERMRLAHETLKNGVGRVTDVAMQFGFNELGRFAVTYHKAFGICPSQTLREARLSKKRDC